jgi:RimJ/RimL family protein N-acetyltransferase
MMRALLSLDFVAASYKSNPELNAALSRYVANRIATTVEAFGPCGSLGVVRNDNVIAAVVFHNWVPDYGVIELSAAADDPRWLARKTIRQIMTICFDQHKCQQIYARIEADNRRACQIFDFLKFSKMVLPNMRGRGQDEALYMMTADEWGGHKLNEEKNG